MPPRILTQKFPDTNLRFKTEHVHTQSLSRDSEQKIDKYGAGFSVTDVRRLSNVHMHASAALTFLRGLKLEGKRLRSKKTIPQT